MDKKKFKELAIFLVLYALIIVVAVKFANFIKGNTQKEYDTCIRIIRPEYQDICEQNSILE